MKTHFPSCCLFRKSYWNFINLTSWHGSTCFTTGHSISVKYYCLVRKPSVSTNPVFQLAPVSPTWIWTSTFAFVFWHKCWYCEKQLISGGWTYVAPFPDTFLCLSNALLFRNKQAKKHRKWNGKGVESERKCSNQGKNYTWIEFRVYYIFFDFLRS